MKTKHLGWIIISFLVQINVLKKWLDSYVLGCWGFFSFLSNILLDLNNDGV